MSWLKGLQTQPSEWDIDRPWFSGWGGLLDFIDSIGGNLITIGDNVSIGSRTSMYINGVDRSANTPDYVTLSGVPIYGSSAGATNQFAYSEQFDNAAWTKTETTITPDITTAPNHTTTADALIESTSTSQHKLEQSVNTGAGVVAFDVYAKCIPGSDRKLNLVLFNGTDGAITSCVFDLELGTVDQEIGFGEITPVGDGWYRCFTKGTSTIATTSALFLLHTGSVNNYTGDGSSGVYIWGAQYITETTLYPYKPTTTAGALYGNDILSFTGNYGSSGWLSFLVDPYYWSNTGNPANAQPVFFEAGSFSLSLDASGFYSTGAAVSTIKPSAGTKDFVYIDFDGVNHRISVNGETLVSAASAVVPSDGTNYLGNTALGGKSAHSSVIGIYGLGSLTSGQRSSLESQLKALEYTFK